MHTAPTRTPLFHSPSAQALHLQFLTVLPAKRRRARRVESAIDVPDAEAGAFAASHRSRQALASMGDEGPHGQGLEKSRRW